MAKTWVCEYSPDQRSFHVCTLARALESNAYMMTMGRFSGFIPLGVFDTALEAHRCAEAWERRCQNGESTQRIY